ncbi:unnamed protein product [Rhizoctonia solani]|uniref:Nephrocystin 3-like N-terminal domain-containing protein n=1 Tax=Rhizoctonia solani TaxID=456999 RepID=A0A8H3BSM3_9AGAM|nr:unnamed protein product [Rhizoctonia solani]
MEVQSSLPAGPIVVIDALDECDNDINIGHILELILSTNNTLPIRFLLSSRPETGITRKLTGRMDGQDEARLVLHQIHLEYVRADIEAFMRYELRDIPLTEEQWSSILDDRGVLFIYASTICDYIKQAYETETLNEALRVVTDSALTPIDELYSKILTSALRRLKMNPLNLTRMRSLLDTVTCSLQPMTLGTLSAIVDLEGPQQANALLRPLRSILEVNEFYGIVAILHASFPKFILSPNRALAFHCNQATQHATMADACLRIINISDSKFNICLLSSSHLLDEVQDLDQRVKQVISPALVYACRYRSTHLRLGEYRVEQIDCDRNFSPRDCYYGWRS